MTGIFRSLCVAGACVVLAVVASPAQATKFTVGSASGTIKATQTSEQVLTTSAGTVRCSSVNEEGTFSASSFESLEVSAAYSGCKAFGFLSATVNMGNCKYKYTGAGQTEGKALTDIVCTSGEIVVTTTGCVVHIPAQTGIGILVYSNGGGIPDDINKSYNITGLKATATSGCPNGHQTGTATLVGGSTLRAFNGVMQVNLTLA